MKGAISRSKGVGDSVEKAFQVVTGRGGRRAAALRQAVMQADSSAGGLPGEQANG